MSKAEIITAYRNLFRAGLHAVQYAKPARFVLRDQLRNAFRGEISRKDSAAAAAAFDPEAIRRTVRFLRAAGRERGLEHRVLRNLLRTAYHRTEGKKTYKEVLSTTKKQPDHIQQTAFAHYDRTVEMLNKTMGLCLR